MNVVIGLGNPGLEYEETRHNIGFKVVDLLSVRFGIAVKQRKYRSLIGVGAVRGVKLLLAKPQTFMNLSGRAARAILDELGLDSTDFIVVHDDIDLDFGKIKKKRKGGDAGHNGIGSIIGSFQSDLFSRVRVGVGRPQGRGQDVTDYVLSPFSREEEECLDELLERATDAVEDILLELSVGK